MACGCGLPASGHSPIRPKAAQDARKSESWVPELPLFLGISRNFGALNALVGIAWRGAGIPEQNLKLEKTFMSTANSRGIEKTPHHKPETPKGGHGSWNNSRSTNADRGGKHTQVTGRIQRAHFVIPRSSKNAGK
jgi:hypothetical protein